jgi:ABC-type dipeptide/oligopeptide/nickel transport system permease component
MDKNQSAEKNRQYYLFAMRIMGDFGATIAIPVVVFVLIGQRLDNTYHTGILFTACGFVLSALISGLAIYRKAKRYGKEYESLNQKISK